MTKVVRYTKFSNNPHGDGGSKRSAQIEEYWRSKGVEFIEEKFEIPTQYTLLHILRWSCRAICFITQHVGWSQFPTMHSKFKAFRIDALRIPVIYDKYKEQKVTFLWEDTKDVTPLYLMKAAGARIIGYPHNMESLVPTQVDAITRKEAPYWLYEEIERLKQCDEVYCISKEETWLLQVFGVNAKYYPYYPPKEVEQELLEIRKLRERRKANKVRQYLILGSATNPPTRMGMQELIDYFAQHKDSTIFIQVAGYQTERLKVPDGSENVNFGTVSSEKLRALLVETDGIIIYQPATSGALTRIVENRIAGIPIYANFGAARDYFNLPDVHVYNSMEELREMLCD